MKEQFDNQQFVSLETFRKSGVGVKTPVWFVEEEDVFYVWTEVSSGKAKRIRNNGAVKIVPSTASGEPVGEWVDAQAIADASPIISCTRSSTAAQTTATASTWHNSPDCPGR